jgi:pimeloyl-ACP methyl ester carboxylesterase
MIRSIVRDRITAGADDVVYKPTQRAPRNPVVYCHGGNAFGNQAVGVGLAAVPSILTPFTQRLFTVVAPTIPMDACGNPAARTRIGEAISWSRANLGTVGPAVLLGTSMGCTGVLNYAADNPTDVAVVVGFIPLIDLDGVRVANTTGLRSVIDAAYGVVYPAALPAGANPALRTSELDIPIQLWTASDDDVSLNAAAFASAVGADHRNVGALGHDNDAMAAVVVNDVLSFIESALI